MAISVRTATFLGFSGSNPAAQNITTQSGDKAVILFGSTWEGGLLTTRTLDGDSTPDGEASQDDGGSGESAHIVVWLNPTIGTISLDWAWAAAPSDGAAMWAVIVQCDGTISFVDADADADGTSTSVTSTCAVNDLAVAIGADFGGAASVGGGYVSGDAVAADDVFNGQHARPYAKVISSGTTINATSQLGVGQVVLRETASAPTLSSTNPADNATGVSVTANLVATFSENVQEGAGDIRIVKDVYPTNAPTVSARNTDAQNTNATSFTIDCPGTPANGDLSIILVAKDDNEAPTSNWPPTGYSVLFSDASGTTHWIGGLIRVCDGSTDPTTVTITESSENWISRGWLVQNADPSWQVNVTLGTVATGTSAAANPPSVNCAGGTEPHLILYYVGFDGNASASAHPGGYSNTGTDTTTDATTTNRCGQAYGELASTTAGSDNPGTLTNTNEDWKAITIAIRGKITRTTAETITVPDSQVTFSTTDMTIDPSITLDGSSQYHVEWDAGVAEAADDSAPVLALTDVTVWNFTTAAAAAGAQVFGSGGARLMRTNPALYNM
jgi:methionine-rich copper-binding protein CopC